MTAKTRSTFSRLFASLWPINHELRWFLAAIALVAPWLFLAITGLNRFTHCHHYPDITQKNGIETYTCLDPKWRINCSYRIKNDTIDVCFRYPFSWGVTLIRHDKDTLLQECRKNKGPEAYIDGSNGCTCFIPLDQEGRCTTSPEHCLSRFGSGAIADGTTSRSGAILVLASKEDRYLICRCDDGLEFDQETQSCR